MEQTSRFVRSWELFKSSVSVMFRHKQLLVFPLIILLVTLVIVALFLAPAILLFAARGFRVNNAHGYTGSNSFDTVQGLYFIVIYFVSMFCATFFNVAFYHEIIEALQGREVSISNGLGFACTRWKSILLWTAFAGVIGFIIRTLEERFGLVGRIIMGLVGTAWSVACVFVIPVIIEENTTSNPIFMLRKSVQTLKQTWGESMVGFVGITFGRWLVLAFSLIWLGGMLTLSIFLNNMLLGAIVISVWLAAIVAFSYLTSVANQIFRCALFLYATSGAMPPPFSNDMAAAAWKLKK